MKYDKKQKQEAEQLTLTGLEITGTPHVMNAVITSPNGQRIIEVNATPEALVVLERAGWTWRWLHQEKT